MTDSGACAGNRVWIDKYSFQGYCGAESDIVAGNGVFFMALTKVAVNAGAALTMTLIRF